MQTSFAQVEYTNKKKQTRRDRFLAEIEAATPWDKLIVQIEPFYPKSEGRGRPPIGLSRMLRMYIVQQCFGLSDEGIEDTDTGHPSKQKRVAPKNRSGTHNGNHANALFTPSITKPSQPTG